MGMKPVKALNTAALPTSTMVQGTPMVANSGNSPSSISVTQSPVSKVSFMVCFFPFVLILGT
jgi:hypothetical protein